MAETSVGRIRVSLRPTEDEPIAPQREEIPRIVRLLALAHRWHRLIDEGTIESQAAIARMTGLTRSRVTQIIGLWYLSPAIQKRIVRQQRDFAPIPICDVQPLSQLRYWSRQSTALEQMRATRG